MYIYIYIYIYICGARSAQLQQIFSQLKSSALSCIWRSIFGTQFLSTIWCPYFRSIPNAIVFFAFVLFWHPKRDRTILGHNPNAMKGVVNNDKMRVLCIVCCFRIAFRLKLVLRLRSRTLTANALFEKCVVANKVPDLNCNCTFWKSVVAVNENKLICAHRIGTLAHRICTFGKVN